MIASINLIEIVVKIGQKGLFRDFKRGERVIRGYADLGYEEFILVDSNQTVSLVNGKVSTLPEEHRHFFYKIPSQSEIIDLILRANFDIVEAEFKDQRKWRMTAQHIETKFKISTEHKEFECALFSLLLLILDYKA